MSLFDSHYQHLPGYPCAWSSDPEQVYRYTLWRVWSAEPKRICMVIGLNPSTASEDEDDPTIRRCIRFAQREKCDALVMTNIFAWRDTDPKGMKISPKPIGAENDEWLQKCAGLASVIIAAWGVHGEFMNRGAKVVEMIPNLVCLGTTEEGFPRHPLYVRGDQELVRYTLDRS